MQDIVGNIILKMLYFRMSAQEFSYYYRRIKIACKVIVCSYNKMKKNP